MSKALSGSQQAAPLPVSSSLPIFEMLPQLVQSLARHSHVVLQAEPGAGKSTQVPLALLNAAQFSGQKILMLEPRRLAAKRLAEFIAIQLGEKVGQSVGYRVRNDNRVSSNTRLEIITEGILTRMIQSDPELSGVGLVIFDEFHERNLQADLSLTLLLEIQENLRDDLKCLIMSATLNEMSLKEFLPAGEFLFCEGRTFPVKVGYFPAPTQTPLGKFPQLAKVLKLALCQTDGDVLLFFAGQAEIHQAMRLTETICAQFEVEALALFGHLNPADQDKVFAQRGVRKVIFSTNIAETSITLPGITAVVDSGLEKTLQYDPNVGMSRLQLQRISQASATQRMGRAGRVQAGRCYRLWSETQQGNLLSHQSPEIERVDLANLRLEIAQWGAKPQELSWLTPPPSGHLAAAESLLQNLQLLSTNGRLTADGATAMDWHPEPRFARLLMQAKAAGALELGCDTVALLQEGNLFLDRQNAGVDLAQWLQWIWQARTNQAAAKRFHRGRLQGFLQTKNQLYQRLGLGSSTQAHQQMRQLGRLLALAYPDRIGKQTRQKGVFKLANGRGVSLPDGANLQTDYIVALEVDARVDSRKKNARLYLAASLDWSTVEDFLPLQTHLKVGFDEQKQRVEAVEEVWLDKLKISNQPSKTLSAEQAQACLLQAVQKNLAWLPWSKAAKNFVQRARWLAQFSGFEHYSGLSEHNLQSDMAWLAPYTLNMQTVAQLQNIDLLQVLQAQLDYAELTALDKAAPKRYLSPAGKEFVIDYSGQNPKVSLPLQQVFGELSSPKLAGGQVNLTFELLSPAQRPIQTTADLANFWQTSYFEVAKEMRGRYPKHRWPEEPLKETAGHSIRRK